MLLSIDMLKGKEREALHGWVKWNKTESDEERRHLKLTMYYHIVK